jgi:hypothetical protein
LEQRGAGLTTQAKRRSWEAAPQKHALVHAGAKSVEGIDYSVVAVRAAQQYATQLNVACVDAAWEQRAGGAFENVAARRYVEPGRRPTSLGNVHLSPWNVC